MIPHLLKQTTGSHLKAEESEYSTLTKYPEEGKP